MTKDYMSTAECVKILRGEAELLDGSSHSGTRKQAEWREFLLRLANRMERDMSGGTTP